MAVPHTDVAGILKKHRYDQIKQIGEGSFGKAILVQDVDRNKQICKMVDVSKCSPKEKQDAIKEGQLLSSLQHPYIVRYRDCFTDVGWLCIIMDFCEGGELAKQIEQTRKSRGSIPEEQIVRWFTQGILALKYIHDKHVLHRDLKPQNFFLSQNKSMKMGDFGIAKVLSCTIAVAKTQIGTPYYLSPELCQEKPYTWPSDIWAMGCILYELCVLKVPFDAPSISALVQKITRGPVPCVQGNYSDFLKKLCTDMLNRNQNARPSTDDILQLSPIQDMVKKMLADGDETGGPPAVSQAASVEGPYKDTAGTYKKDDLIEYNSSAHKEWLPAVIINVDETGRIIMDLKPNTWLSIEQQARQIRPRSGGKGYVPSRASASPRGQRRPSVDNLNRPASRGGAAPMRQQSPRPSSRGGAAPSTPNARLRSGSEDRPGSRGGGTPMRWNPSVDIENRPASRGFGMPMTPVGANGLYAKGDAIEYYSGSHGDWLPAFVINTDGNGRIIIDLKPSTWMSKEEQTTKIRRRIKNIDRPGSRGMQRVPSAGAMNSRPQSRGAFGPPRAMTPSGGPPRAMTPSGGRTPSLPPIGGANFVCPSPQKRPPGVPSPLLQGGKHIAGL